MVFWPRLSLFVSPPVSLSFVTRDFSRYMKVDRIWTHRWIIFQPCSSICIFYRLVWSSNHRGVVPLASMMPSPWGKAVFRVEMRSTIELSYMCSWNGRARGAACSSPWVWPRFKQHPPRFVWWYRPGHGCRSHIQFGLSPTSWSLVWLCILAPADDLGWKGLPFFRDHFLTSQQAPSIRLCLGGLPSKRDFDASNHAMSTFLSMFGLIRIK